MLSAVCKHGTHLSQSCLGLQCFSWLCCHGDKCSGCSSGWNGWRWASGGRGQGELLRWCTFRKNTLSSVKYEKSQQCIRAICAADRNQTMLCTISEAANYASTGCHVFCQQNVIWFLSCLLPCCGKLTPVAWASSTRYMSLCLAMDSVILTCWLRWSFRDSSSVWALFKLCSSSPRL